MTHAMLQKPPAKQTASNLIQRKCSCGKFSQEDELCGNCQRKTHGNSSRPGRASAHSSVAPQSSGSPLDAATRAFMERGFQADFSSVRIHTGAESSRQAEEQGARAYTSGQHIVFGEAQYDPRSAAGRELIAHELTHTIQQGQGLVSAHNSSQSLERFETEADNAARRVTTGKHAAGRFSAAPRGAIQRLAINNAELDEELDTEARDGDSPVGGLRPVPSHSELVARATRADKPMVIHQATRRSPVGKKKASPKKSRLSPVPKSLSGTTISHIDIDLSSQRLTVRHADGSELGPIKISSGKGKATAKGDPCANPGRTNSNCTPTGTFKPSALGDAATTNKDGAHMSWFVKFDGDAGDRGIGIHNSQPVTGRPASHGCIRINESTARYINERVTRETEINVHGKAPTGQRRKLSSKSAPRIQRLPNDAAASSSNLLQRKGEIKSNNDAELSQGLQNALKIGAGAALFEHGAIAAPIGENIYYVSGTKGINARGPVKPTGALFIYRADKPNKMYRLDFHPYRSPKAEWHHNWEGRKEIYEALRMKEAGIHPYMSEHAHARKVDVRLGRGIKLFKGLGKAMLFVGLAQSGWEIYRAENKGRQTRVELGGWLGATVFAEFGGALAATFAVLFIGGPIAIGAATIAGIIIGSIYGSAKGEKWAAEAYDAKFQPMESEQWEIITGFDSPTEADKWQESISKVPTKLQLSMPLD